MCEREGMGRWGGNEGSAMLVSMHSGVGVNIHDLRTMLARKHTHTLTHILVAIGGFLIAIAAQFNTYPVMVVGMIFEGIGAECGVVSYTTVSLTPGVSVPSSCGACVQVGGNTVLYKWFNSQVR